MQMVTYTRPQITQASLDIMQEQLTALICSRQHLLCMQAVTFHPHINQHSLDIMQERRGSSHSASFLNRLEADIHGRKMRLQVSPIDDTLSGHIAWTVMLLLLCWHTSSLMLAHQQPHACTPAALCLNSSSLVFAQQQPRVCTAAASCLHTSSLVPAVASVAAAALCLNTSSLMPAFASVAVLCSHMQSFACRIRDFI